MPISYLYKYDILITTKESENMNDKINTFQLKEAIENITRRANCLAGLAFVFEIAVETEICDNLSDAFAVLSDYAFELRDCCNALSDVIRVLM